MSTDLLLTALHVVCGVLAYGLTLGNLQEGDWEGRKERWFGHVSVSILIALTGWFGWVFVVTFNQQDAEPIFRFRNPHREDG